MSLDLQPSSTPQRRWSIRWFPWFWCLLLLLLWGVVVTSGRYGVARDVRTVLTILLGNLAWIGLLSWVLFAWPSIRKLARWKRWGIRLAALFAVATIYSSIDVDYDGDMRWKAVRIRALAETPDQRLAPLAGREVAEDWQATSHDYPRFLGGGYWAEVSGVRLDPDWAENPPELVWKRPIGAGWSAFAIVGDYAVTQEQRGDEEIVSCYRVSRDEVVWTHADRARHDPDSISGGAGGIGPRATPTIADGRIYTMGATGIVNCLDARTGDVIWSHQLAKEYDISPLMWANSGSPLVLPDAELVVVGGGAANQPDRGSLLAFDRQSGELRWRAGPATASYASPIHAVLGGVPQIVQVSESAVGGYRVSDGEQLWSVEQPGRSNANASCSQPIPLPGDQVLVSKGYGIGSRLIQIERDEAGNLDARIVWKKPILRTKLANLIVRGGYAYGLDDTLLGCAKIDSGQSQWKKRRRPVFGHGQLLLVGDLLLVLSEEGEGVLVECNPEQYVELASMQMLRRDGITWNNPSLAGPYLLVRNKQEAACYRLPLLEPLGDAEPRVAHGKQP